MQSGHYLRGGGDRVKGVSFLGSPRFFDRQIGLEWSEGAGKPGLDGPSLGRPVDRPGRSGWLPTQTPGKEVDLREPQGAIPGATWPKSRQRVSLHVAASGVRALVAQDWKMTSRVPLHSYSQCDHCPNHRDSAADPASGAHGTSSGMEFIWNLQGYLSCTIRNCRIVSSTQKVVRRFCPIPMRTE